MAETLPSEGQALSPAEKTKLAMAKKAEAAKKAGPVGKPLIDNEDGTVTDPNSGYLWKKTDAWLDVKKFYTWQDHREYVDWVNKNKDKFGGYDNWRIPNKAEALTLFDKTGVKSLVDKNGTSYPIDSIFAPGGASNTWITECTDEKIIRMDLKIGIDTPYPTQEVWSSMRLIRRGRGRAFSGRKDRGTRRDSRTCGREVSRSSCWSGTTGGNTGCCQTQV